MWKKVTMLALAMSAALAINAQAADTIKGLNQNGQQESFPIEPIASIKYESGKLYYRHQFGNTVYWIDDAAGTQKTKVLAAWSGNYAVNQANGWTYNLRKSKVACNPNSGTSIVYTLGQGLTENFDDGCQFWQTANGT